MVPHLMRAQGAYKADKHATHTCPHIHKHPTHPHPHAHTHTHTPQKHKHSSHGFDGNRRKKVRNQYCDVKKQFLEWQQHTYSELSAIHQSVENESICFVSAGDGKKWIDVSVICNKQKTGNKIINSNSTRTSAMIRTKWAHNRTL